MMDDAGAVRDSHGTVVFRVGDRVAIKAHVGPVNGDVGACVVDSQSYFTLDGYQLLPSATPGASGLP